MSTEELGRRAEESKQAREKVIRKVRSEVAWEHLSRNQKEVAKRIMEGNYGILQGADWGFLDKFIIFLETIGFLKVLDVDGQGYQRRMITISKLLLTYQMKILSGIGSMNQVPEMLFNDTGLLMLLGFTARQIKYGHCKRSRKAGKDRKGPMHKDTLSDALERFGVEEVEKILNESVKIINEGGFIGDDIYICDSTDIETTEKCSGCGRKTVEEEHINKQTGEITRISKTTYGFKLILIRGAESGIIVSCKMAQIQESEKNYIVRLIKQAQKNTGNKMKVILMDRGFMSGENLWEIKHKLGIDFIIPAMTSMDITKDARGWRDIEVDAGKGIWREENGEMSVVGISGLESYDQYGDEEHNKKNKSSKEFKANPMNVVMVTRWDKEEYKRGKEKVFLTSLRVDNPLSVIGKYQMRSLIENTTFRELKTGWLINNIPKKTEPAVRTHAFLTVCMFNMCKAYRSQLGKDITEEGIIRFRRRTCVQTRNKIVIISEQYYGIFDLEELAILWGKPPQHFISIDPDKFRQEYGFELKKPSSDETPEEA